jgi:uncharacterized protein with von Willebrand factor type A (vWA) domain
MEFIKALRGAGVPVSTAEAIDAVHTVNLLGYQDRERLKLGLSLVVAKSEDDKQGFNHCFDHFFSFKKLDAVNGNRPQPGIDSGESSQLKEALYQIQDTGAGEGSGGSQPNEQARLPLSSQSALGTLLFSQDQASLSIALANASRQVNLKDIRAITQKGIYGRKIIKLMGLDDLEKEMWDAENSVDPDRQTLGHALRQARNRLREDIKDHVEKQFLLHATEHHKKLRQEIIMQVKLEHLREFKGVQEQVRKLAKKLIATNSRRKKVFKRGQLDVRATIRSNMPHDGTLFKTRWKTKRVERPKIMAICDVSGSVSQVSRFFLMFLYSLTDVLPRVRAFAFSSHLGEVTRLFEEQPLAEATEMALDHYGGGSTNYGESLNDFSQLCLDDLDHRTTVIILGDGRNNFSDPRTDIMKLLHERSRRVIWLNPENRKRWGSGDSEMKKYLAYCTYAEECNSLAHLERFVSHLLRYP